MDPKTGGSWEVVPHTCEACRVLEATIEGDREGKSPPRGRRYVARRTVLEGR